MDPFKPFLSKPRTAVPKLSAADAEVIALKAIAWILADDEICSRFMGVTGCDPDAMRQQMGQPAFLGAALDFLLGDDASVLAFAAHEGIAPELPMLSRHFLP